VSSLGYGEPLFKGIRGVCGQKKGDYAFDKRGNLGRQAGRNVPHHEQTGAIPLRLKGGGPKRSSITNEDPVSKVFHRMPFTFAMWWFEIGNATLEQNCFRMFHFRWLNLTTL